MGRPSQRSERARQACRHQPAGCVCPPETLAFRYTKITLGNGAPCSASPNVNLPFTNRISVAFIAKSCHHFVSVRAGKRKTANFASGAFASHLLMSGPYGGLQ